MDVKGYRGRVSFDGQTVTISKALRGDTRLRVQDIAAVEINRAGIGLLAIRFVTAGSQGTRTAALGSTKQAQEDPYAMVIRRKRRGEIEALRAEVEKARV